MQFLCTVLFFPLLVTGCDPEQKKPLEKKELKIEMPLIPRDIGSIGEIPAPRGFQKVFHPSGSFGEWLRSVRLKEGRTVYLYNGTEKPNQSAQFAVLDISTGKKDLQQCADAVMRLRSEYHFVQGKFDAIAFMDYNGKWYRWQGGSNRKKFDSYLENVFGWCGSASLEKQLNPVNNIKNMQTGDVFIKGGFPGHAVIVADMAENEQGEKVYLLVQGYQPAQDMHVLVNPVDGKLNPWYKLGDAEKIVTPEWVFYKNQLKRW